MTGPRLRPGTRLGPYEVVGPLGAGGMGEVHRARHLKLRRDVAIKVLPIELAAEPRLLARFEREARSASALNHPNIVTIYDIAEQDGITYIAMELVQGRTLRSLIADGPLPIEESVRLAQQIADGLAKAHEAGIVHRDIKPANVVVTPDGLVKILDFGVAKPVPLADREARVGPSLTETQDGLIVGTPHYMSPEQFSGGAVDHRSDQFAFGVLLYEMVGGRPPFDGPSIGAIFSAILMDPPQPLKALRPDVPAPLERIIDRCLEKEAEKRFTTTAALGDELRAYRRRRPSMAQRLVRSVKRPAVAASLAAIVTGSAGAGGWWIQGADARWAKREAPAEIARLTDGGDVYAAYRMALQAERYRPDDVELARLMDRITLPTPVTTEPEGAEVWVQAYGTPDAEWERVGVTPFTMRMPYAMLHWRITREGYEPFEGAPFGGGSLGVLASGLALEPLGSRPRGMVRVPGGPLFGVPGLRASREGLLAELAAFHLDRYEVTNGEFKRFIDEGGYKTAEWWPSSIERDGWETFRDATGRLGPATWELGDYPAGQDDYPVGGISWFEAAAYCAFAGKALPSLFHWFYALGQEQLSDILLHSNVDGAAVAPVGQFNGLGGFGTYDMAGNVKEWVWNASGDLRYAMGGAWNEPAYLFRALIAQDPWTRDAATGVRCAEYTEPPSEALLRAVTPDRSYALPEPIDDRAFDLLRGLFAYDRTPLEARVERTHDSLPHYRRETVSFRAAYGDERMEVHLFIPRDVAPPYQSVIWFPGGDVFLLRSSERFSSAFLVDFIPRGGRVLVHPVYEWMYERFEPRHDTPSGRRDAIIRWAQDIGRTLDYLATRPDFDTAKVAFYGLSSGAALGPLFTAVEPRFDASVLLAGGLMPMGLRPETDPANFAARSRTPTLMINGRDDFMIPYELAQRPAFEMLGTPEGQKRHAVLDGGHIPSDTRVIMREVLDWLDRWLGPVRPAATMARAGDGR